MSFMLIGLFVPLLLGAFASGSSDDDDDGPNPEEIEEELNDDGTDLLVGTAGDDTISVGLDDFWPETIDLLGGNDTAILEINYDATVIGGDGDDSITATGVVNTVEGGAGNDTLTADDSNQILGGEGDDVLNFNHGSYDQGDWGIADGGEGDDTITVRTDALVPDFITGDVGGVNVSGGNGADEINIIYELVENFDGGEGIIIGTGGDINYSGNFIRISDFVPNQDTLVVEVERDAETADRDVTVELDQTEEDGTYTSLLTLTFEETDEEAEAVNVLTIFSAAPFTLDDVQLVGVQAS